VEENIGPVIKASLRDDTKLSSNIDILAMTIGCAHLVAESAPEDTAPRRSAMAVLVEATAEELAHLLANVAALPAHEVVRPPETGLVMVQGRIGGDGAPFNIGEATVSRAAVRLASGQMGFGYVLGRACEKARLLALCDALMQSEPHRAALEREVLTPLRARIAAERRLAAERTAATKVDFFTLVRGDN
jgi:alpha-D-ribose 1-methylphosphonate 5-triphosphate synthase subunit PhnG